MSRKCNTAHPDRGRSHYRDRLAARGLTKAPAMAPVERLRARQQSEGRLDENPAIAANLERFRSR